MAKYVRQDIDPSEVTIDNISYFENQTVQAIDQATMDIHELHNLIRKEMRIFSNAQPLNPERGMLWAIQT